MGFCCSCWPVSGRSDPSVLRVLLQLLASIRALGLVSTWCSAAAAGQYPGARTRQYLVFCCSCWPVSGRSDSSVLGVLLQLLASIRALGLVSTWCSAPAAGQYPGARTRQYLVFCSSCWPVSGRSDSSVLGVLL